MELIHELNKNLLEALQQLLARLELNWSEWVVNTLVLHHQPMGAHTITLRTSATLYYGKLYHSESDCDEKVKSLGEAVPLIDSYSGFCLRAGSVIWVDNIGSLGRSDPLLNAYRNFRYVGVLAPPPESEFVFPIRVKTGFSEALLGVLNMEWYRPESNKSSANPLMPHRNKLTMLLTQLLDLHGLFVMTASSLLEDAQSRPSGVLSPGIVHPLRSAHQAVLERYSEQNPWELDAETSI